MKPNDDGTLDHAGPDQLARLLSLAADHAGSAASLPATLRSMGVTSRVLSGVNWPGGGTAADALARAATPGAPLADLRDLKAKAKTLLSTAAREDARDALTLLYHVTIAAGYGEYGENLSSRPLDSRAGLYEDLSMLLGSEPAGQVFGRCLERMWGEDDSHSEATG